MLSSVDDWLARQPSLIDRRKRALLPVLRERQQLADSLLRHLQALGLERSAAAIDQVKDIRRFLTRGPSPLSRHQPVLEASEPPEP